MELKSFLFNLFSIRSFATPHSERRRDATPFQSSFCTPIFLRDAEHQILQSSIILLSISYPTTHRESTSFLTIFHLLLLKSTNAFQIIESLKQQLSHHAQQTVFFFLHSLASTHQFFVISSTHSNHLHPLFAST